MAKILLVEDDRMVARFLTDALVAEGHSITWARNGRDGIEKFSAEAAFDLVLTDCHMPFATGVDVVRHVRKASPAFPVIVLSASSSRDEFETFGVDAYLEKPISLETLVSTVRRLAARRVAGDPERRAFPRRGLDIPVTIASVRGSWTGRILDISHEGVAISSSGAPTTAGEFPQNLRAYFRTPSGRPADFEVRYARTELAEGTVGFRFGPLTSRQERTILELLAASR